ncbi:Uncharacterised protein [Bordetella pertussis]|nr:Uncharacterised protein [Bordetella pertussis]
MAVSRPFGQIASRSWRSAPYCLRIAIFLAFR